LRIGKQTFLSPGIPKTLKKPWPYTPCHPVMQFQNRWDPLP